MTDKIEILDICLQCEPDEFHGFSTPQKTGASKKPIADQVIWRKVNSHKDETKEKLWCYISDQNGKSEWKPLPLHQFPSNSWDGTVYLTQTTIEKALLDENHPSEDTDNKFLGCRGVLCFAFKRQYASLTLRRSDAVDFESIKEAPCFGKPEITDRAWTPSEDDNSGKCLFSFSDYCTVLYDLLFGSITNRSGLIVIMGATSSGKTEISYGLMHQFLEKKEEEGFRHVVTLEDPIEKSLCDPKDKKKGSQSYKPSEMRDRTGVEYTARDKKFDTKLKAGLDDCLRQKPTVVYAGEVRAPEDWRAIIDFAGTGHLVVATAHAGSLTEAMDKILFFLRAKTPAARSEVARKILGMVHLHGTPIVKNKEEDAEPRAVLLTTVWRRAHGGADKMMSEGIDSIAPFSNEKNRSSLGAVAVAEKLMSLPLSGDKPEWIDALISAARERDLQGI